MSKTCAGHIICHGAEVAQMARTSWVIWNFIESVNLWAISGLPNCESHLRAILGHKIILSHGGWQWHNSDAVIGDEVGKRGTEVKLLTRNVDQNPGP